MTERGWGRVVATGSVMASRPRAETVAYAALKSAQLTTVRAIARDGAGAEHLVGLTSAETSSYLAFRKISLGGNCAPAAGISEHIALYEKHRKACRVRLIEPGE